MHADDIIVLVLVIKMTHDLVTRMIIILCDGGLSVGVECTCSGSIVGHTLIPRPSPKVE